MWGFGVRADSGCGRAPHLFATYENKSKRMNAKVAKDAKMTHAKRAALASFASFASLANFAFITLILFALPAGIRSAVASELPADSLYQLDAQFTDHNARIFKLADRRGRPQLVALFYTSCKFVCPLIIDSVKGVDHALTPAERDGVDFLLISIDPARDDVAALALVASKRKLDAHWTLARTDERSIRKLAALLGVRYRALADGEFNHTSTLYLLDADGRKLASSSKLGTVPDPAFVAAVSAALDAK